MRHENSHTLFRYWEKLRAGRASPYRAEIDPREIASLLDTAFILERVGSGEMRFRLAGSRLCTNLGLELRGMSACSFWQGKCRVRVARLLERVLSGPCIGRVGCTAETMQGCLVDVEILYLPLASDSGQIDRVIGVVNYFGDETLPHGSSYGTPRYLRHWVERVERRPVVDRMEEILFRPAREGKHGQDFLHGAPILRVIEGGRSRSERSGSDEQARSHLRLVHTR